MLVPIKAGDQHHADNPNAGCKEGMFIEHGQASYNDDMKRIFAIVDFPDAMSADVIAACQGGDEDEKLTPTRSRSQILSLKEIAQTLGDPGLVARWKSGAVVEPVRWSGPGVGEIRHKLKPSRDTDWGRINPKFDRNAIFGGINTWGASGTYSTLVALAADMGTLTSNLIARMVGDATHTATIDFNTDWAGFNFTIDSDDPHNGDVNAGHTMSQNNNSHSFIVRPTNPATFECQDFTIKEIMAGGSGDRYVIWILGSGLVSLNHDMFINGNGFGANRLGIAPSRNSSSYVYNNVIWEISKEAFRLYNTDSGTTTFENNVSYNNGTGFTGINQAVNFTNNVSFSNILDWGGLNKAVGNNNACTDATGEDADFSSGSGNLSSLTIGDEVISEVDTSTDFMRPKEGSNIIDSGKVPATATVDMSNVTYATPFPMGAYMPAAGGPPVGTLNLLGVGV